MQMRADDGEVEFVGLQDVAGDALYVGRRDFLDAFQDFFHRAYLAHVDERSGRVPRYLVARFERERHRAFYV